MRDRFDGAFRVGLNRFDFAADVLGGFRGLFGQLLHFVGDHCETLSGLAGARGFDGGVEREQIGLLRDGGDDFDDLPDFGAAIHRALTRFR